LRIAATAGVELVQTDCTIIAQLPRVAPHSQAIRRNLSRLLGLDEDRVNVKATTEEGLGFTGAREGIKAVVLVSALRDTAIM
jgi:2-C-methyl-D-erythritol 4-phosphate cytidylyltransferase/2-C-methyl-D-erythritol 2,4-cyclodiphosphate synthase